MNSAGYGQSAGQREAPACVQNAMMTKDKKPFTYTPGGIDLSQIKSERMAKRLARNAQADGAATGSSQQNRPTQTHSPNATHSMGAAAMGMPFQVLPPPPPPPPSTNTTTTGKNYNGTAPPPPPPPSSNTAAKLAPSAQNAARKSPTPQRFEPPPMGFRPEIKIPTNPMSTLRKVAPPVEKNTFWKDEYVKDRSKSPMVGENDRDNSPPQQQQQQRGNDATTTCVDGFRSNNNNNNQQQYAPQQQSPRPEFRSVTAPHSPSVNVYTRQTDSPLSAAAANSPQPRATESPFKYAPIQQQQQLQQQQQQQRTPQAISPLAQQSYPTPTHTPTSTPTPPPPPTATPSHVPWRVQRAQQQQQQQPIQTSQPIYNNVQQQQRDVMSPSPQQYQSSKPTNVGSLYIAPLAAPIEPQAQNIVRQQLQQQQKQQQQRDATMRQLPQQQQPQQPRQPERWMSTQSAAPKEQPEWARAEENGNILPSTLQRIKSPPPSQLQQQAGRQQQQQYQPTAGNGYGPTGGHSFATQPMQHTSGLRLQINAPSLNASTTQQSGAREHIIPITLEQTPTNTPAQPNFVGGAAVNAPPASYVIRSPNQFVDQGYNNFTQQHQQQQQQQLNAPRMIQQQQQTNTRVVPIAVEGDVGARGPIAQSPVVLQNDPRTPPLQSKSFRVLQKITDTDDVDCGQTNKNDSFVEPTSSKLQQAQIVRQMNAQQARNSPTIDQMRRMQIGHDQQQQQQQSQAWNQDMPAQQYVRPSEQQAQEPKIYTGSAIPSRSFKILQAMTTPENAGPGQSDL